MTLRYEFQIKGRSRLAKPYHLKGVGLPNVYLLNGVEIEDDPDYGKLVTIANLPDLHRAIGCSIVLKREALTGDEMRYLRKQMQATQSALARMLRVNQQTVANYEKGKTEAGAADFAIRALYLAHLTPEDDLADILRELAAVVVEDGEKPLHKRSAVAGPWREVEHRAS